MLRIELEDGHVKVVGNPSTGPDHRTMVPIMESDTEYVYFSFAVQPRAQLRLYEQLKASLMRKGLI